MVTTSRLQLARFLLALLVVFGVCLAATATAQTQAQPSADEVLANWPETPREVAMTTIEKYGQPDGVTESRLIWHDNGPWKTTIVYRDVVQHDFPMPHPDLLEQVIDYQVPPEMFDELAVYDGSVIVERTKGTMAARCDKEEMNFLALNLAHDIVTGQRTVEEARQFYAETAMAFMNGETSPYTQGLQFEIPSGTPDPDQPVNEG